LDTPANVIPVNFLMVVGDGRDDEVIFRWANELGNNRTIEHVTTVSLGSRNTEAGCTLTQGVTGKVSTKPEYCKTQLTSGRCLECVAETRVVLGR
jgi:trehalose-6-phosphatase